MEADLTDHCGPPREPAGRRHGLKGERPPLPRRGSRQDAAPADVPDDLLVLAQRQSAVFPGIRSHAATARRWIRFATGLPTAEAGVLELLVSELFANALRHSTSGQGGEVAVAVIRKPGCLQVKVTDAGPRGGLSTPHLRPIDPDREDGRGLHLVHAYADRWGVICEAGRTTVWFDIRGCR